MTSLSIGGRNEHCHPWGPRRAIVENIERNPATLLQSRAEGGLLARLPWCIPVSIVLGQGLDS